MSRTLPQILFWNCILFLTICSACNTADAFVSYQVNGDDGVAGDPGTDGTDGQVGDNSFNDVAEFLQVYATAMNGGRGGRGGDGVDGADENDWAAGGNGGHGGRGGDAHAIGNQLNTGGVFSWAGNGGNGGRFGFGSSQGLDGFSGNGGNGGNAIAEFTPIVSNSFRNSQLGVTGGNGGHADGWGARAGNGGTAVARLNITNDFFQMRTRIFGGFGGNGTNGADGGDGAHSIFGYQPDSLQWNRKLGMNLTLWGGGGGSTVNGIAGKAGAARVSLSAWGGDHQTSYPRPSFVTVRGGAGGKGWATGSQSVSGQRGAIGLVDAPDDPIYRQGFFNFSIRGGNGGSALGRHNSGNGAHGAAAMFRGTLQVDNRFDIEGESLSLYTNYTMNLRSGDGGHAQGSGRSGNGASVNINQPLSISTRGVGRMEVNATAGSGGWGRYNGNGGSSSIFVDNAIASVDSGGLSPNFPQSAEIFLTANGGFAGGGSQPINGASGGDATVTVNQAANRSVFIDARANSGGGNYGRSGDATVVAVGQASLAGEEWRRDADVRALAQGAKFNAGGFQAAIGSNAMAHAEAINDSNSIDFSSSAKASSRAFGGWGFQRSGSADSIAIATGQQGPAVAKAGSLAMGDSNAESENYSKAHASATSLTNADAFSHAVGSGATQYVLGTANAQSASAVATSLVESQMSNWQQNVRIETTAQYASSQDVAGSFSSGSGFSFRGEQFRASDQDVSAELVLMPEQSWSDGLITTNSMLGNIFVDSPTADVIGLGRLASEYSDLGADGILSTQADMDFSYQARDFQNDENLILGLFGLGSTGNGFSEMALSISLNGRSLIDETFDSLTSAELFFDSQWFDLGAMPSDREMLEFDIYWHTRMEDAGDSYQLGFVFGNATAPNSGPQAFGFSAVPEPSGASFIGLLVVGGLLRRKR